MDAGRELTGPSAARDEHIEARRVGRKHQRSTSLVRRDRLMTSALSVILTLGVFGGLAFPSSGLLPESTSEPPPPPALCELYPIAIDERSLEHAVPGDVLRNLEQGTKPGNFGWLTWDGRLDVSTLARSLTPPGDSGRYVNPDDASDHDVSVGDSVVGRPGAVNAGAVRVALDQLKKRDARVAIWDEVTANGDDDDGEIGSRVTYRVSGFALVRLLDYRISGQARITIRFLGFDRCGPAEQRPPVASDAAAETAEDTPSELTLPATDPDGDPLTFSVVSGPSHGSLGPVSGDRVTYTPAADFHGADSFMFRANDGSTNSNVASFQLTVTPVNDSPVCPEDLAIATPFETPIETAPDCRDVDGDTLTYEIAAQGTKGTALVVGGRLRYEPGNGQTGVDGFRYRA